VVGHQTANLTLRGSTPPAASEYGPSCGSGVEFTKLDYEGSTPSWATMGVW